MTRTKGGLWTVGFLLLFLLTQDYLFVDWPEKLSLWGLPAWLWWFVPVHLLFLLTFYLFSRNFWKE